MKQIILLAIAALSFTACNEGKKDVIIGKWQVEERTDANGQKEPAMPEGETLSVVLTESGDYASVHSKGTQIDTLQTGKYSLLDGNKKMVTVYRGIADTADILEVNNTTMKLSTGDGVILLKKIN